MFCDQGRRRPRPARPSSRLSHRGRSAKARRNPVNQESSMISRYTRPEIASLWEAQTRFKIWFEIEAHAADALAELGVIPTESHTANPESRQDRHIRGARIFNTE